mmetsp:Transcript_10352/g.31164  ORF Transcript_10352/g.31164 Transcript_10352/m.31164 type:complete len:219 (+) Transcript_10352:1240-1896(+)
MHVPWHTFRCRCLCVRQVSDRRFAWSRQAGIVRLPRGVASLRPLRGTVAGLWVDRRPHRNQQQSLPVVVPIARRPFPRARHQLRLQRLPRRPGCAGGRRLWEVSRPCHRRRWSFPVQLLVGVGELVSVRRGSGILNVPLTAWRGTLGEWGSPGRRRHVGEEVVARGPLVAKRRLQTVAVVCVETNVVQVRMQPTICLLDILQAGGHGLRRGGTEGLLV